MLSILLVIVCLPLALWLGLCLIAAMLKAFFEGLFG